MKVRKKTVAEIETKIIKLLCNDRVHSLVRHKQINARLPMYNKQFLLLPSKEAVNSDLIIVRCLQGDVAIFDTIAVLYWMWYHDGKTYLPKCFYHLFT